MSNAAFVTCTDGIATAEGKTHFNVSKKLLRNDKISLIQIW